MKRKDLYNYVREQIINELTEGAAEDQAATATALNNQKAQIAAATAASAAADAAKKAADTKKAETAADKKPGLTEDELNEMSRIAAKVSINDPERLKIAREVYGGSNVEKIIDLVVEAGEEGITQEELAAKLNISPPTLLNSDINVLVKAGAFKKPEKKQPKSVKPKPEADLASIGIPKVVANPDEWEQTGDPDKEEIDVKDDWEKPEEEEGPSEDEPKVADIKAADKEAEKTVGGKSYAQKLSPEDEEKYTKLKKGIENKVAKLMDMTKAKREESDDIKILKQLINRDDVKKLFKAKGINLKDLTSDIF
jgi:hypothetical protein